MKRVSNTLKLLISGTVLSFSVLVTSTVAWFSSQLSQPFEASGNVIAQYFETGTGTESDPFIIANGKHMYYLAWLQYLGFFNGDDNSDNHIDKQYHFALGNDVDMSGYVLPPIGTKTYPFLGTFDGAGYIIANATVSNNVTELTDVPAEAYDSTNSNLLDKAEIIGFFGVVGEYTGAASLSSGVASASNFVLSDIQVKATTSEALAGLAVGYINGEVEQIGILGGNITASNWTTYVDARFTQSLSSASLYGYAAPEYMKEVSQYDFKNYRHVSSTGGGTGTGGAGEDDSFGGSLDFGSLAKRLTYMRQSNKASSYNLYYDSSNSDLDVSSSTVSFMYIYGNTYIPFNVTNDITQSFYTSNSSETIKDKNNGYLVGSASTTGGTSASQTRFKMSNLDGWTASNGGTAPTAINDSLWSNMEILTKVGDTFYAIEDDDNTSSTSHRYTIRNTSTTSTIEKYRYDDSNAPFSFSRYSEVKTQFKASVNGLPKLPGLHFMNNEPSINPCVSASNVSFLKSQSGQGSFTADLVASSMNFKIGRKGKITALGTTNFQNGYHNIFDIFRVNRNADTSASASEYNKISSIQKISQIYKSANGTLYYDIDDNLPSVDTLTLLYDRSWSSRLGIDKALFYFEIPVKAGEYCIGGGNNLYGTSRDYGCYLMYLDVGSNGEGEVEIEDGVLDAYSVTQQFYSKNVFDGIDVISNTSVLADLSDSSFELQLRGNGTVEYARNGDNVQITTSGGITVTPTMIKQGINLYINQTLAKINYENEWTQGDSSSWVLYQYEDGRTELKHDDVEVPSTDPMYDEVLAAIDALGAEFS